MIIMINGAFGVGKTSVANEIVKKIKRSIIYDPEEIGLYLRQNIPTNVFSEDEKTGDFQDIAIWKSMVVGIAEEIKKQYNCNLVVPMTIRKTEYFQYILRGFKNIDKDTHHFCLTASIEMIHKRLTNRGDLVGSWAFQQTEKCLDAFTTDDYKYYINTENMEIYEVVENILEMIRDCTTA